MAKGIHSGYQTISGSVPSDWAERVPYSHTLVKGTAVFISHFYCPWTRAYPDGKRGTPGQWSGKGKGSPRQQQPLFVTVVSSEWEALPVRQTGCMLRLTRCVRNLAACHPQVSLTNETDFKVQASSKQPLDKTVRRVGPIDFSMCRQQLRISEGNLLTWFTKVGEVKSVLQGLLRGPLGEVLAARSPQEVTGLGSMGLTHSLFRWVGPIPQSSSEGSVG